MRKFSDTYQPEFKLEMNDMEIKGIEATLDGIGSSHEAYGLAYTSTSGYAMYNVLNSCDHDGYEISHFAITRGGTLIMVCVEDTFTDEVYHYYGFEQDDIFPEVSE